MLRSRGFLIFLAVAAFIFLARDRIAVLMPQLPVNPRARTTDTRVLAETITPRITRDNPDRGIASGAEIGITVSSEPSESSEPPEPSVQRVVVPTPQPSTVSLAAEPVSAQAAEPSTTHYKVKAGDTMFSIAQRFGIDVDTLIQLNPLSDPTQLHPDQELIVPAPPPEPKTIPEGTRIYIVQGGDTLAGISRRLKVSIGEIQRLNNLPDPNRLKIGQKLLVPINAVTETAATGINQSVGSTVGGNAGAAGQTQSLPVATPRPTKVPVTPPPPTPTATPTPDLFLAPPYCETGVEQVAVWGVHFCSPVGWNLYEQGVPDRGMFLSTTTEGGETVVFAIIRPQAIPNAPLSVAIRSAKESAVQQVSSQIPEGLVEPSEWSESQALVIAGHESQAAEADTTYGLSSIPAKIRVIVFNHEGQRWQIIMVAPKQQWRQYATNEFALIIRSLTIF